MEESPAAMVVESHVGGGAITIASPLTPDTPALAIERLAHQMPDALQSRTPPRVPL